MTIKEQFEEVAKMANMPEKNMNKKQFYGKCMLLMASLEDETQPVDKTVFDCLGDKQVRDLLEMIVGVFVVSVMQD